MLVLLLPLLVTLPIKLYSVNVRGSNLKTKESQEFRRTGKDDIPTDVIKNVVMGRSQHLDIFNKHYYFFVYDPKVDVSVSKTMINEGGMWEAPLNLLFKSLLKEVRDKAPGKFTPNVIDLGVNFGAFTLFAASQGSRIWGFDIQRPLLTLVDMGLRLNDYKHDVKLFNVAAWDRNGLNFTFVPEKYNLGGTSAKQKEKRVETSSTAQSSKGNEFYITSRRIDNTLEGRVADIFFLKMDCEGCEPAALLGMDTLVLSRSIQHVVLEIQGDPSILEIFYRLGYKCRVFDDKSDCLFPSIEKQCTMETYAEAEETFKNRRPYSHWNYYMDVHCWLPMDPRGRIEPLAVPLDQQRKQVDVEGKLMRYVTRAHNGTDVYIVKNGARIFVSTYAEQQAIGGVVRDVSYAQFFLFPFAQK